jgi:integrase
MRVTVRQKQKGRGNPWWVFVHHNNQRKSLKIGSKKMAEKTAAEIRRRARLGKVTVDGEEEREDVIPKFGDYADHFLETYAKTACKRNTWLGYISAINYHLKPAWAEKRLDRITRAEVKRLLLKKQRDGLAPATVNNLRNIVSAIYTFAREDEVVDHNPAKGLGRYIKKVDQKQHIQVLTREQSRLLLETVKAHFPWHYPIILCAFRTGMRMGELLGLGWEDVDFEANTITVRRSYTQHH